MVLMLPWFYNVQIERQPSLDLEVVGIYLPAIPPAFAHGELSASWSWENVAPFAGAGGRQCGIFCQQQAPVIPLLK